MSCILFIQCPSLTFLYNEMLLIVEAKCPKYFVNLYCAINGHVSFVSVCFFVVSIVKSTKYYFVLFKCD